ncbi:MAG: patatin-like phospholipase family protein, partial [Candidatus Binatia bacterium]
LLGHTVTTGFFDTSPLDEMLRTVFPTRGIADAISRGHLYAVAVTATSYHSGRSCTFVQGRPGHPIWIKSRRVVVPTILTHRHVLASSAIPILFPPVRLEQGGSGLWFGDGALRLVAPMSPAIRLGASRILAVGIRSARAASTLAHEEAGGASFAETEKPGLACPPLAQVCGVFFNAIFLDHLDADVEHLRRMNALLTHPDHACGDLDHGGPEATDVEGMRRLDTLVVSPSEDLALVAQRFAHRMPRIVRYMLDGLGIPDAQSADLMSYLLFDSAFTRTLIDIGWRDTDARIDEIEEFVRTAQPLAPQARWQPHRLRAIGAGPEA